MTAAERRGLVGWLHVGEVNEKEEEEQWDLPSCNTSCLAACYLGRTREGRERGEGQQKQEEEGERWEQGGQQQQQVGRRGLDSGRNSSRKKASSRMVDVGEVYEEEEEEEEEQLNLAPSNT